MWNVYVLLAATTLIAGLTPIAARMATAELPPLTLAFFRFGSAGVLLVLTARALGLRWSISPSNRRLVIKLGVLVLVLDRVQRYGVAELLRLADAPPGSSARRAPDPQDLTMDRRVDTIGLRRGLGFYRCLRGLIGS
jgi:hypothetical protein